MTKTTVATPTGPPDQTLGADQLETLTGLTERRIRQLGEIGKIPRAEDGRWPAAKTLRQLFDFYRTRKEPDALTEARLKKLEAEAAIMKMREEQMRSELLEAKNVRIVWTGMLVGLRQAVNATDAPLASKARWLKELADIKVETYL